MKPEFIKIIRYINMQYVIVDITGPFAKDICRCIVETRSLPKQIKDDYKRGLA